MDKIKRPNVTEGHTDRVETGCGSIYITVAGIDGNIIEIFATLGKAGQCSKGQLEGITRCISLGLKYGVPLEEYYKELVGIKCPNATIGKNGALSCSDAIAKVLKMEIKNE